MEWPYGIAADLVPGPSFRSRPPQQRSGRFPKGPAQNNRCIRTRCTREGDPAPARAGLLSAIEEGVPAFNGGDPERCRAIYRTALREVVNRPELTDGEQALVRGALEAAEGLDPERAAWRLRFGIDAVLAGR